MNFMRAAELCECKFHELCFANVNFMRHEHCECEFYELSFAHVNFMRAELGMANVDFDKS